MITVPTASRRAFFAASLLLGLLIIMLAAVATSDRSVAQTEPGADPEGPLPLPALQNLVQTPVPELTATNPTLRVRSDVDAVRFRPQMRVTLDQPSVPSPATTAEKTSTRFGLGSLGLVGPQESYVAPNYAEVLAPQGWNLLVYEGFEGLFPGEWLLYDNNNEPAKYLWGDTNYWSQVGSWAAWPAIYGTDAVDPATGYRDDMDSWLVRGPFDFSAASDIFVGYGLWYDTEPEFDWVYLCASIEWPYFDCDYWSGNSAGWIDQASWFTSYAGYSDVYFAWRFSSDGSIAGTEGFLGPYVDEITIWSYEADVTPTPTPDPAGELIVNGSFETGDLTGWLTGTISTGPIQNGGFENGPDGSWDEYSTNGWDLIVASFPGSVAPHNGFWAAWLGGADDEISVIAQDVTIPPGSPILSYWHWIASSDACNKDYGGVLVDGTVVDVFSLCTDNNTGGWARRTVNLGSYAGQTVYLDIRAETDSAGNSNLFIDDVTLGSSLLVLNGMDRVLASPESDPTASLSEPGAPAGPKSDSRLAPGAAEQDETAIRLLGVASATLDAGSTAREQEHPSSALSGLTRMDDTLGLLTIGVTSETYAEGTYSAYLWHAHGLGLGVDVLYQTINVPAAVDDLVLDLWFGIGTLETVAGNDWFCINLADPSNHGQVMVDLGCVDAIDTNPNWQELVYALDTAEVSALAGTSVDLVFYLFSDVDLFDFGPGTGSTKAWVDYVRVYATGGDGGVAADPNEPNDNAIQATAITCGQTITTGVIGDALGGFDADWYALTGVPTGRIDVDINAKTLIPRSALDSVVTLWDGNTNYLDENDDDGISFDSYLVYTNTVSNATFYISVESYSGSGSADSVYHLTVECADSGSGPPPPGNDEPGDRDAWTIMLYLNAEDPNFEATLTKYRTDIEGFIGSKSSFLNVVILYDGQGDNNTTRYLVQPGGIYADGTNRWPMGELNMGHPGTLENFVTWAMDQYPADHYYLAVDDHGDGAYGISWDPNSGNDQLTAPELYGALKGATRNGARKIDIFDYEACLMGLAENAYDLKDWVDYVIFFQQISWGINTYPAYFGDLAQSDLPVDVGRRIIDRYYAQATQANGGRGYPHTISLIDTNKMVAVRTAATAFGSAIMATDTQAQKDAINNARGNSQAFAADNDATDPRRADYIDLWDLANTAGNMASTQAAAVKSAVDAAVVHERHASGGVGGYVWDHAGAHGLSVYFPPSKSSSAFSGYGDLYRMSAEGGWDEFLSWALPRGIGRGMSAFRTEIKLSGGDTFVYRYRYLPTILR